MSSSSEKLTIISNPSLVTIISKDDYWWFTDGKDEDVSNFWYINDSQTSDAADLVQAICDSHLPDSSPTMSDMSRTGMEEAPKKVPDVELVERHGDGWRHYWQYALCWLWSICFIFWMRASGWNCPFNAVGMWCATVMCSRKLWSRAWVRAHFSQPPSVSWSIGDMLWKTRKRERPISCQFAPWISLAGTMFAPISHKSAGRHCHPSDLACYMAPKMITVGQSLYPSLWQMLTVLAGCLLARLPQLLNSKRGLKEVGVPSASWALSTRAIAVWIPRSEGISRHSWQKRCKSWMRTRMVMSPEKSVSHMLETMLFTRTKPFCWATQERQHLSFAMLSLVLGPSKLRELMAPAAMTLKSRLPLINMAAGYWTCRWQAQRIAQKPFTHIYSLIGILKGTTCHIKNELFSWFLYKEDFSQKTLRQPSKPCLNSLTHVVWSSREAACSNMMQKRRRKEWSANSVNASTSTGLHLAMMMVCGTTWNHCLQLMKRRSRSGTKKRLRRLNMMWNNVRFNCNICKMNIINFTGIPCRCANVTRWPGRTAQAPRSWTRRTSLRNDATKT